ncbi:MAG: YkgJ family cysteine cluster protein [Bacteroidales bacterium]|nr:MAG: YkgJ family cysteine cluster protein [Bacteroidales bacterium]
MSNTKNLRLHLKQLAGNAESDNKNLLKQLKRRPSSEVDALFQGLHDEVFEAINCLDCANCCSTISPIITDRDIDRMAKVLRMKPSEVVAKYLRIDEDNDYVYRNHPCPFLGADNYCSIYEERPKACREYPHTDRRKAQQLFSLTLKNAKVCPAVYLILERAKNK